MRKIKTQSSARSYRDIERTPKTNGEVANSRLPPRNVQNIRHAHLLKGVREIPRVGWQPWEPEVAEALRNLERQRYEKANRYYNAVERIQTLLETVRRRSKQAEEAAERLEESSTYLQTVMDTMVDTLVILDASGVITDVNRAMETLVGYDREELVGAPFERFFADPDRARQGVASVLLDGGLANFELELVTRSDRRIPLSTNATLLHSGSSAESHVVVSARDITQVKEAQEALTEQATKLARSNAELEQFAYVASHDLQEPLRKIRTFADVLRDILPEEHLGQEEKDYLFRMQDAASRMQTLIQDLLSFSRITTRAQACEDTDFKEVVDDVLTDLDLTVEEAGAQVETCDLPTLEAEPSQIRQLFQNLISNAVKFRREDVPCRVRISGRPARTADLPSGVREPSRYRTIEVADNGIGFDPQYAERIFTVFQRLHGREEYPGTGIGLAVCRKIVERHHGRITAQGRPGEGSIFFIVLPVRQPADPPALDDAIPTTPEPQARSL